MEAAVCVIGAGPAGSIVASELARRGIDVLLVDSGPRHDPARRAEYARRYRGGEDPWRPSVPALDPFTNTGTVALPLDESSVWGVGGGTLRWDGYALRLHADDFRLRSRSGVGHDWPLTYEQLERYYGRAESALGVAGAADDPWASPRSSPFPLPAFPFSYTDQLLAEGARRIGIALASMPQARNSVAYGGRPRCTACNTCAVCPTSAKATADLTHAFPAEATGSARIMSDTTVLRLETDGADRVKSAICAGADRQEKAITARVFVLAAGAVETARLLLLSTSSRFPQGLGNQRDLVGSSFMSHPRVDVLARFPQPVFPYRIGFSTAMCRRFAAQRQRDRQGAFFLEFLNSAGEHPGTIASASGLLGEALRRHVQEEFGRTVAIRVYAEQLPSEGNRVTLDPVVRDYFGRPVARLAYNVGIYERNALEEGRRLASRILLAAGSREPELSPLTIAPHQIGTCRMSRDPRYGVVDLDLSVHGVPNLFCVGSAVFPTAGAVPPTLTIAALAMRAADRVALEAR
jgi:glucose dehydrogenase